MQNIKYSLNQPVTDAFNSLGQSTHLQTLTLIRCALYAIIAIVLTSGASAWANFQGEVVRVLDGDTIDVLVNRRTIRVRLIDIDAPESGQAFSQRAHQRLAALTYRQIVEIAKKETDQYGRILGTVYVNLSYSSNVTQRTNINAVMVEEGMAWAYRYDGKPVNLQMYALEKKARSQRRGLWSDSNAQEPWKWRRKSKINSN